MVEGGGALADVPLERLMGRGVAVDARGAHEVGEELLRAVDLEAGDMVVVVTGFSAIFAEPRYFTAYPDVTEAFARRLLEVGVRMLCLDSPSPDRSPFPVHRLLLGSGILIAENLRGAERLLGDRTFDLFAFPVRLEADGAPARIAARVRR